MGEWRSASAVLEEAEQAATDDLAALLTRRSDLMETNRTETVEPVSADGVLTCRKGCGKTFEGPRAGQARGGHEAKGRHDGGRVEDPPTRMRPAVAEDNAGGVAGALRAGEISPEKIRDGVIAPREPSPAAMAAIAPMAVKAAQDFEDAMRRLSDTLAADADRVAEIRQRFEALEALEG